MSYTYRLISCLICLGLGFGAGAVEAGKKDPMAKKARDAADWAKVFDDPERRIWQKPFPLVRLLGLRHGDVVADLGSGTGYFLTFLAVEVGETGRVYAVDVDQEMLDHSMARDDMIPGRVTPILAPPDDPSLPDGQIDLVFVLDTWHHIKKRSAYIKKIRRSLSEEGRVAIVDFYKHELPVGPPVKHKLAKEKVVKEFAKAGWTLGTDASLLPYQYVLIFHPPRDEVPPILPGAQLVDAEGP